MTDANLTKRYAADVRECVHGHDLTGGRDSYGGCRACRLKYTQNWRAARPGYTTEWNRVDRAKTQGRRVSSYDELVRKSALAKRTGLPA